MGEKVILKSESDTQRESEFVLLEKTLDFQVSLQCFYGLLNCSGSSKLKAYDALARNLMIYHEIYHPFYWGY